MKRPLIILTGPTAVGKTSLSIRLAKAVGADIISADSMQVYRGRDIGTAKIRPEEMEGVTHYLIDEIEPDEEFHVVRFQELAKQYMEKIYEAGRIPLIVGGTGFYIQSVLYEIAFTEHEADEKLRSRLAAIAEEKGAEYLHEELRRVDPASAEIIHANNVKRVIRALEYYEQTGTPISKHNEEQRQKESTYEFAYFVLNDRRDLLYERINRRVDCMMQDGLLNEVKKLKDAGYSPDLVSMQGIGYKEMLKHLNGEMTLKEAVESVKQETRHFAKRQVTWFKREKEVIWLDRQEYPEDDRLLKRMLDILKQKNIIN